MKALIYDGPGRVTWGRAPDPALSDPQDAIVGVEVTTICGTDLHILRGDVPEVEPGRVLGHEAVGEVLEVGPAVRDIRPGQRVVVSCVSGCGRCRFCRAGRYGQCLRGGGWVLGHVVHGTQAEFVRVPFADLALHPLPSSIPVDEAVLLCDVLPTAFEVGTLAGRVEPGDTVVVVGAGPIGLAAVVTAALYSPARILVADVDSGRLEVAKRLGADVLLGPGANAESLVAELTDGLGADVVIEAVGSAETFDLCTRLLRPGGRLANIGVHGKPVTLHLERLWSRDVTITTGLVDTYSTPRLLDMFAAGQIAPGPMITHRFALDDVVRAYDLLGNTRASGALKIALSRA